MNKDSIDTIEQAWEKRELLSLEKTQETIKDIIENGKTGDSEDGRIYISDIAEAYQIRTGEKGDSHGMSAFIIEKGTEGFSAGKKEDILNLPSILISGSLVFSSNIISSVPMLLATLSNR